MLPNPTLDATLATTEVRQTPRRSILRIAWDYARQLLALGLFFGIAIGVNVLAGLIDRVGFHRGDTAFWQAWVGRLFRFWVACGRLLHVVQVDLEAIRRFADLRGTIITANHPSIVDAFVLLAAIPRGGCIMRSDLTRNPALRTIARLAGYIPNDSGSTLVRRGLDRLARGDNLIVFPEGTRSGGASLRSFKRGFALIATRSRAGVQTIILSRSGDFFAKGVGLLDPVALPVKIHAHPGSVFHAKEGESPDAFANRLEAYFRSQLLR